MFVDKDESPLPSRLKTARKGAGLSQRKLGVLSGIDEFCAGPRVNQYEKGTHTPSFQMVRKFAKSLNVPTHYFYIEDDQVAKISLLINKASDEKLEKFVQILSENVETN